MKNESLKKLISDEILKMNSESKEQIEILTQAQAAMINGGNVAACSGCDGTGGIRPPITKIF